LLGALSAAPLVGERLMRVYAIFVLLAVLAVGSLTSFNSDAQAADTDSDPLVVSAFGVKSVDGRDLIVHVTVVVPAGQTPEQATGEALRAVGARPLQSSEFSLTGLEWNMTGSPAKASPVQRYNGANDPTSGLASELDAILALWSAASTAFEVTLSSEVGAACPSLVQECGDQTIDGKNDIAWGALNGGSTLGVTWYDPDALEADVMLNTKFQWTLNPDDEGRADGCRGPSSRCTVFDAFTVMIHEEGHVVGVGHSNVSGAVMEPVYEGVRRSLHADDIAAVQAIYEGSTGGGGGGDQTGVHVESITHDRQGGRHGDKNLVVTVHAQDASGADVSGAEVSIRLDLDGSPRAWVGTGTTGTEGTVSFTLANATKGCYTTTVTELLGEPDGTQAMYCDP
jgi:hypothetical protein